LFWFLHPYTLPLSVFALALELLQNHRSTLYEIINRDEFEKAPADSGKVEDPQN
jgi:hypothetical protein